VNVTIDFGGTNIKIGLVEGGTVMAKTSLPAYSGNGLFPRLPVVVQAVHELLRQRGADLQDCQGIGVALPGIVDSDDRRLIATPGKYSDAIGIDFGEWIQEAFSLPCVMENDARAALLGEAAYGMAKGARNAVMVTFGTGIGTAAMMDGQVVRGAHYQAGILGGHLTTDIHGGVCICGNKGCLEAQSGAWALTARAAGLNGYTDSAWARKTGPLGYEDVIRAASEGEEWAGRLLDDLIGHWSAGIVNLIHAYDPEVVVLSGGLMKSADRLLPRMKERVLQSAWTPWGTPRFVVANDPDTSVLLGLSHLVKEKFALTCEMG
jgi:glucokinase